MKKISTDLAIRLKDSDVKAFDAIYNAYCHKLHQFVLRYLKQEEDAKEIVQEVFVKIWEVRGKIDVYASFESFLFTIAYNATISLLRKRMSETKSREVLKATQQIANTDAVIDEVYFNELNAKVQRLLNELTPRQKEIFKLSREEGLSHKEIAAQLNISENTVKNHLVTTLRFLKMNLDKGVVVSSLYFCLFF